MLHRNLIVGRGSGGFKGVKRMAGIALAQLVLSVGILAVLTAGVVAIATQIMGDTNLGQARTDLSSVIVAINANRRQSGSANTVTHGVANLRAFGASNIFAADNPWGDRPAAAAGVFTYGFDGDQAACETMQAFLVSLGPTTPGMETQSTTTNAVTVRMGAGANPGQLGSMTIRVGCDSGDLTMDL